MRPGFNRRLFLLGAPGTEGWENIRPFRPGVIRAGRAYPEGSRLRETLTLCCGTKEAVSPGDGLLPPDETAFETPRYLIRITLLPSLAITVRRLRDGGKVRSEGLYCTPHS